MRIVAVVMAVVFRLLGFAAMAALAAGFVFTIWLVVRELSFTQFLSGLGVIIALYAALAAFVGGVFWAFDYRIRRADNGDTKP